MILVTGVSSSGSTFLTRLLGELGLELGEVLDNEKLARGAEWRDMAELLSYWESKYSPLPLMIHGAAQPTMQTPSMKTFFSAPGVQLDIAMVDVRAVSAVMPEVVKSSIICRWLDAWLELGGKRPEHVIVCHRPLEQVTESFIRDRLAGKGESDREEVRAWLGMSYGMLMDALHKWELEYTVVRFPQSVEDVDYLYNMYLSAYLVTPNMPFIEHDQLVAAHSALADPDLIHVKEEENDG